MQGQSSTLSINRLATTKLTYVKCMAFIFSLLYVSDAGRKFKWVIYWNGLWFPATGLLRRPPMKMAITFKVLRGSAFVNRFLEADYLCKWVKCHCFDSARSPNQLARLVSGRFGLVGDAFGSVGNKLGLSDQLATDQDINILQIHMPFLTWICKG